MEDFWKCNFYCWVTRYFKNRKYGLVDEFGDIKTLSIELTEEKTFKQNSDADVFYDKPVLCDFIWKPNNELFKVRQRENFGFINAEGKEIIKCRYQKVETFKNGLCKVNMGGCYTNEYGESSFEGGKWGFVNLQGDEQIPIEFSQISEFEYGFICGVKQGIRVMVDTTGNIVNEF